MRPVRVGVVCDMREEGWHSMDLVADMLFDQLPVVVPDDVIATRLQPSMVRRWTRLPVVGAGSRAQLGDRLTGRLWDYPRWLRSQRGAFEVFHIVDHSYAHLIRALPAERTIVTCNDTDAFEAARDGARPRLGPARLLAEHVLDGISRASHVACISEATRQDLIATGRVDQSRTSVVYLGVHPTCTPVADPKADAAIERLLGTRSVDVLHVSSTAARKRIDVLLEMFSVFRRRRPDATLVRVGGALTHAQTRLAEQLDVINAIVQLPFLERRQLAALYRRASIVVLPSDREGFGLPLVEAMACGTPVIASDIPALREVGGTAAVYAPPGDVGRWVEALEQVVLEQNDPAAREQRRTACLSVAAKFDWRTYAAQMAALYLQRFPQERAS
ncbi:MAG TPA: glycosyltransferase family 1 protein [Vicinamibacterales bacterium]|nr:glycosyltransferase family 1 protein [Vicinamibacterales bacterium]